MPGNMPKFLFIFLFFTISLRLFSQEEVKIIREFHSIDLNYRKQEIFFRNDELAFIKNYAINGWQILDSTVYFYSNDSLLCYKSFEPVWNNKLDSINLFQQFGFVRLEDSLQGNKIYPLIDSFQLQWEDCILKLNDKESIITLVKNKFLLANDFLSDLNILLKSGKIKSGSSEYEFLIKFKRDFIPNILLDYGIPQQAQIISATFTISDSGLLKSDYFNFDKYTVSRDYKYNGDILEEVIILTKNKLDGTYKNYSESFKIFEMK